MNYSLHLLSNNPNLSSSYYTDMRQGIWRYDGCFNGVKLTSSFVFTLLITCPTSVFFAAPPSALASSEMPGGLHIIENFVSEEMELSLLQLANLEEQTENLGRTIHLVTSVLYWTFISIHWRTYFINMHLIMHGAKLKVLETSLSITDAYAWINLLNQSADLLVYE